MHKNVYLGDTDADGIYSGFDSAYQRVVVHLDSGFDAHDWTDPLIVGDASGGGGLTGLDAAYVAQKSVFLPRPEIPNLPGIVLTPIGGGIDPELSIADLIPITFCGVDVPVNISIPVSELVSGATFNVTYDTDVMDFEQATQGAFWSAGDGWGFFANEGESGVVTVTLYNANPSAAGSGTIASLQFHVTFDPGIGIYPVGVESVSETLGSYPGNEVLWTHNDGSVQVTTSPAYQIGDTDHDLDCDLTDLTNVLNHIGSTGLGDTDCDNDVDLTDLTNVLNHIGSHVGGGGGGGSEEFAFTSGDSGPITPQPLTLEAAPVVVASLPSLQSVSTLEVQQEPAIVTVTGAAEVTASAGETTLFQDRLANVVTTCLAESSSPAAAEVHDRAGAHERLDDYLSDTQAFSKRKSIAGPVASSSMLRSRHSLAGKVAAEDQLVDDLFAELC